jgi:5-methylcytosine-specific restriction endonuclease McrA
MPQRTSRPCAHCGCEFSAVRRDARFCSGACRTRAHQIRRPDLAAKHRATTLARQRKKPVERTCEICNCSFLGRPNANVCSKKCRNHRAYLYGKRTGSRARNREEWRARQRAAGNGHKLNVWSESKKAAYQRRRAIKSGADAERFTNAEIFDRDRWRCGLCGGKVDPALQHPSPMSASLDHIVPLSVPGGPGHVRANVQLAHLKCNTTKRDGVAASGEQLRLIG